MRDERMTPSRAGTVERAFELARDSQLMTVEKIRQQLKIEGYLDWDFQLSGRAIRRQLQQIIAAKRAQMGRSSAKRS